MPRLHIIPGDSAGGSLRRAVQEVNPDDEVLSFRDDLSCGPIDPASPSARAAWWAQWREPRGADTALTEFWGRVAACDDRLVVWFGRHSALELAFFHAWCERIDDRGFDVIDVTGRPVTNRRLDGAVFQYAAKSVGGLGSAALGNMLGSERPISEPDKHLSCELWKKLRQERAAFRIVTDAGLMSAPIQHFDEMIVGQATPAWKSINGFVHDVFGIANDRYQQVGDVMLRARVLDLARVGRLVVDGDHWTGRVRSSE